VPVELIAEVSSNHGGSVALAREFIWRFAEAGADWIKFQTTRVKHLRPDDPQRDWFIKAELSDEAHHELKEECAKANVRFLTTVYHHDDVPFVRSVCDAVKVGSGEANEYTLRTAVYHAGFARIFVGCGLGTVWWQHHADLLRCVTRYPAPAALANYAYGREHKGWSDHCVGLDGCQIAICRGATIIEKHVCLPNQARDLKPYEATAYEFKQLRAFADDDPGRFIGRWQAA
jgi:N,N'-diacetyllegionaminate synthase